MIDESEDKKFIKLEKINFIIDDLKKLEKTYESPYHAYFCTHCIKILEEAIENLRETREEYNWKHRNDSMNAFSLSNPHGCSSW